VWEKKLEEVKEKIKDAIENTENISTESRNWIIRQRYNYNNQLKCMNHASYREKWERFISDPQIKVFMEDPYLLSFLKNLTAYYEKFAIYKSHQDIRSMDKNLAEFRYTCRDSKRGNGQGFWNQYRETRILELMPDFFKQDDPFDKCIGYYTFYVDNGRNHAKRPKKSSSITQKSEETDENFWFRWRNNLRVAYRKKNSQTETEEKETHTQDKDYWQRITFTNDMETYLKEKMPDFFEDLKFSNEDRMKNVETYCKWYKENERQPNRHIAEWRSNMKAAYNGKKYSKNVLTNEMIQKLLSVDPLFFKDDIKTDIDRRKDVDGYIEWRRSNSHPPTTSRNFKGEKLTELQKDQKKWSLWASAIRGGTSLYPEDLLNELCEKFPEVFDLKSIREILNNGCKFQLKTGKRKGEFCGKRVNKDSQFCSMHRMRSNSLPEQPLVFLLECPSCGQCFSTLNDDNLCQDCATKKPLKPKPQAKTEEEIRNELEVRSKEELVDKLTKMKYQSQANNYNSEKKGEDFNKQSANQMLSTHCPIAKPDSLVLILDTKKFLTTDALIKKGYAKNNIFIPQYDRTEYEEMKKQHARVFNTSLYDCIAESEDCEFTATWFDYTCTPTGSDTCRPMDDINLYFARKLAEHESLFAVTFCKRNAQIPNDEDVVRWTKKQIYAIAKKNGYVLTEDELFEYDNMFYIHFVCTKKK
jgi:hypothetical protein